MPSWLNTAIHAIAAIVILYLVYRVVHNQRWYRLFALTALATGYFSAPALKLVIKAYGLDKKWGFDVDAAWNESSWTKDVVAALVFTYYFLLERDYSRGDSHQKYFNDFKNVVLDNVRDGIEAEVIAKKRKIPFDKVEAIICCMAWLGSNQHKKKQNRGDST